MNLTAFGAIATPAPVHPSLIRTKNRLSGPNQFRTYADFDNLHSSVEAIQESPLHLGFNMKDCGSPTVAQE